MDAFFASVEQRDFPELRGKPVAVGGNQSRGVVAAASYEARQYGVRSAMPSKIAAQKCRNLIFVKPRFGVYKKVSTEIRHIFYEYTDLVEPLSLDEAYLDVTENKKGLSLATQIANEIRSKIFETTGLTASAGISMNKFLAKVASDVNKPNGFFVIHPSKAEAFVAQLPIKKFHGIGKVTAERMEKMGIKTGEDLRKFELNNLIKSFGKAGNYYYHIARAIDFRAVVAERKAKSISVEHTFENDLTSMEEVEIQLSALGERLKERTGRLNFQYKTITLKLRYNNFETINRSKSLSGYCDNLHLVDETIKELLAQPEIMKLPVRLVGIGISNLLLPHEGDAVQLTIGF